MTCTKCKFEKDVSNFKKHRQRKNGLYEQCRECVREYRSRPEVKAQSLAAQRKRYQRPHVKEMARIRSLEFRKTDIGKRCVINSNLRITYGISINEYDALFTTQKGCCAICEKHQVELTRRLHVDHDHKTGKIRGLLCHYCNTSLGGFKEDSAMMKKAIEYLNT